MDQADEEKTVVNHIAIDGPSGAGKSTIARRLANELQMVYVDTGAMYRAIGVKARSRGIDRSDEATLAQMLSATRLGFLYIDGKQHILIDGEDAEERIRTPQASEDASVVSAVPAVRKKLTQMQRELAENQPVVMDGRDIGTHVLPNARFKFFLTASVHIRANRRYAELQEKGDNTPYEQVLTQMVERDHRDSNRAVAPLRPAQDAVTINSDDLDIDQVVEKLLSIVRDAHVAI